MSMQAKRNRFCCVRYCSNFYGTKDLSVFFFGAPEHPELRAKWYKSLTANPGVQINPNFGSLCNLHFDPNDMEPIGVQINNKRPKVKLRNGALPLPIELPDQNIKFIDVNAIKGGTNTVNVKLEPTTDHESQLNSVLPLTQPEGCDACAENELKLRKANAKIAILQKRLNETTAENKMLMRQLSLTANTGMKADERPTSAKCDICWKRLKKSELNTHLCLDREFLKCSYCPKQFNTTQSLVDHLNDHADDKKTIFKCRKCPYTYPMLVLLDCHKLSHIRIVDPAELHNVPDDSNKYHNIMEPDVLIDESIAIKTEITDRTGDEELPVQMMDPMPSIPTSTITQPNEIAQKYFKCGRCGRAFELPKELMCHMKECCKTKPSAPVTLDSANHNCSKCGKSFSTSKKLLRHVQLDRCIKSYECYICHESNLKSIKEVRHHLKEHEKNRIKCTICKWRFEPNEIHLCGNKKSVQCEYCKQEFTATTKLLNHLEKDHDEKRLHRCTNCSSFYAMHFLKDTCQASHVDMPKRYTCGTCSKSFGSRQNLSAHKKKHKTNIEKKYLCDACGKGFQTEHNLAIHKMSVSHQEPTFQCPDCPKKFVSAGHLKRHSDIHQNNKYVCEICGVERTSLGGYSDHMRRHRRTNADRRFSCTFCPLKFFELYDLKTHQAVHTGAKNFRCRFCDQAYKYKGDLNKHLKTHLGDKIHECPQCPMRFQYLIELQKHSFEHYKEEKANGLNTNSAS